MENGNLYILRVCVRKFSTPGRFPYLSYSPLLHFCVLFLSSHPNMKNRALHQPVTHLKTFSLLWSSLLMLNYIIFLHFLHGITASFSTAVVNRYFVSIFLFRLWFRFFSSFFFNIYTKVLPRSQNCLFPPTFFLWDALHLNILEALVSFSPQCSCCEMDAELF